MRFLLLLGVLTACSTDTFVAGDAGDDRGLVGDGAQTDAPATFDPTQLGGAIALWLDAADATTSGGDLVVAWPDHQKKNQTSIQSGSNAGICTPGLHLTNAINISHPAVSFCSANLVVKDTGDLRPGNNPFYIAAVMAPPADSAAGDVLYTKSPGGAATALPTGLTFLGADPSLHLQGWMNGNASVTSTNPLTTEFHTVTFIRESTQISLHVDGAPAGLMAISANDSSSNSDDVGVGGYAYNANTTLHAFKGQVAELVVVNNTTSVGLVELYFKKKYGL